MRSDARTTTAAAGREPSDRVDVCVIGAGPAGALCAYTLADRGYEVVMLEAGRTFDFGSRYDQLERAIRPGDPTNVWEMGGERDAYVSSGQVEYALNHKRVKGVGGSSLHWGATVWRLHEKDFEMNTRYDLATDWPIGYEDLRPYYVAAEQEIGISGRQDNPFAPPRSVDFPMPAFEPSYSDRILADAAAQLGIETHSVPRAQASEAYDGRPGCVAYARCGTCPSGAKYTAEIHVRKAIEAGARVVDRVPVQRLEHDDSGETLHAAVYATPDGETHRQAARQFVVACGGVETPRLLLQSASSEHADGLANESGAVGRYFMEHPGVKVHARHPDPTRQQMIGFSTMASQQYYDHGDRSPGSIMLEFRNGAGVDPIYRALIGGDARLREQLDDPIDGIQWGDELLETLQQAPDTHISINVGCEQLPAADNRISLDRSRTDDHGVPVPDVSLSFGTHVRETLTRGIDVAREILEAAGAEVVDVGDIDDASGAAHHMGTTRMGTDPDESVVDPRLRTHDVDNLWIASSSVFPTGGAVNPTLTIAALALKAADHIDDRL